MIGLPEGGQQLKKHQHSLCVIVIVTVKENSGSQWCIERHRLLLAKMQIHVCKVNRVTSKQ